MVVRGGPIRELHDDRLVYYVNDVHFRELIEEEGFREVARSIGFWSTAQHQLKITVLSVVSS